MKSTFKKLLVLGGVLLFIELIAIHCIQSSFGATYLFPYQGGLGTTTVPISGQIPIGSGSIYAPAFLTAGSNITITTSTGAVTIDSTGGGTPGGSNTQIQFNNASTFGGVSSLTFSSSTGILYINGQVSSTYGLFNQATSTNLFSTNALFTNSTSTNSGITNLTSTNGLFTTATSTNAGITNLTTTNGMITYLNSTYATSTGLSIGTLNGILRGSTGAVGVASPGGDYELPLTFSTGLNRVTNTITNTGVLSNIAGTGIGVSGATGNVTITNNGVQSLTATTPISITSATGTPTISLNLATTTGNLIVASSTSGYVALAVGTNGKVLTASSTAQNGISWETPAGASTAATSSVRMKLTANQNIGTGVWTKILFDSITYDGGGEASTTLGRVSVNNAGKYLVTASFGMSSSTDAEQIYGCIYTNGSCSKQTNRRQAGTDDISTLVVTDILNLAATNYVELYAYAGSAANVVVGSATTQLGAVFNMKYLSP